MRLYGILPGSRTKHVPVPRLPASNVRHGWDGHAPHTSAVNGLVLGDLSVCHRQTRHSAVQLSRTLGICYESAWYLLHRIRAAMGKRDEKYELSGIVEMGDGCVGRVTRNGRRLSAASGGQDEGCGVCSDAAPPFAILSFDRQRRFLSHTRKKAPLKPCRIMLFAAQRKRG